MPPTSKLSATFLRAGVANIMAYSWLSHCKRYLELLEGEKRFLRSYKVPPSGTARAPLSLDAQYEQELYFTWGQVYQASSMQLLQ